MPSQKETTIAPTSMKKESLKVLKETLGEESLATVKDVKDVSDIKTWLDATDASMSFTASKYLCSTQPSAVLQRPKTSDWFSLQLGSRGEVPRWKKGSTVNFAAFSGGYPNPSHAAFAAYRLNEAASKWNSVLQERVTFQWVSNLDDAAFVLAYGGDQGTTLARGYFPNSDDLNTLYVYQKAFEPGTINNMVNVFLHELGHVLGLRHEFAAQEGDNVPFGTPNPRSVMSYTFPPEIQPTDETDTRAFYDLPGGSIGVYPIHDYIPDN